MKYIIIILFLLVTTNTLAQEPALKKAMADLNNAMLKRDSVVIKKVVDDKIKYSHSNGWVQTRQDMINDMYNGKLLYTDIHQSDIEAQMEGSMALVRSKMTLSVAMNSKPMDFNLAVLQVWMKKKTGWVLIARQSGKF